MHGTLLRVSFKADQDSVVGLDAVSGLDGWGAGVRFLRLGLR
jgi:hypothetical protein